MAHLLTMARQTLSGRPGVLLAVYRGAFKRLPAMLKERVQPRSVRRVDPAVLAQNVSSLSYGAGYATVVLTEWGHRLRNAWTNKR
jgi:hypothetical protein